MGESLVYGRMRRVFLPLLGFASLVFLPLTVSAAEPTWHLNVQAYSFHENTSETDLHNTTPGLGLLRRQGNWMLGAGVFRNSIGRWAGYGYGGYQWPVWRVRVGGIAGITHNYEANDGGAVPLAAAVVTIPLSDRWSIDLVGIPRVDDYTYTTLNVSVSWRFR